MTAAEHDRKLERKRALEALLACPGYPILIGELTARLKNATDGACNLNISGTQRKAFIGEKRLAEDLLTWAKFTADRLSGELDKEKARKTA